MRPSRTASSAASASGSILTNHCVGDHRLDNLTTALRARHVERVRFFFDDQAGGLHVGPQFFAAGKPVQTRIRSADFGHFCLPVQHRKDRQSVALADGIVVGVVAGGDFQRPGAKLAGHIFIGDDRDLASQHRHDDFAPDEFFVALVIGMDRNGGIAQDGFRAGGGDRDEYRLSGTRPAYI